MCKPTTTITAKVEELMELRKLAEELQEQMDAILSFWFLGLVP